MVLGVILVVVGVGFGVLAWWSWAGTRGDEPARDEGAEEAAERAELAALLDAVEEKHRRKSRSAE